MKPKLVIHKDIVWIEPK